MSHKGFGYKWRYSILVNSKLRGSILALSPSSSYWLVCNPRTILSREVESDIIEGFQVGWDNISLFHF